MIALRPFRYAGKKLKPGSKFDISKKKDVQILSTLGSAKEFVPETGEESKQEIPEKPDEPEEISAPVRKPARRYKRRDMKAEDV
jgi:hypothetical protein